jgi:beta-lactamase superfamily II metal-dependent hydrolase
MKIDIFNVGHGNCALVTCPNGKRIMVDCGYRTEPGWFPSVTFARQFIDLLVISNLDEDHVNDFPYVWRDVLLGSIFSNPSVTAQALATMKSEHGMGDGIRQTHAILERFGSGMIGRPADIGSVSAWAFWNRYGIDFTDTNNLSLAVFVRYGAFTILFAGDLETAGWKSLLRRPDFKNDLASVNLLVASHHGRKNGRCEDAFKVFSPDAVVFSDDHRQYDSQNTDAWYRARTKGIIDQTSASKTLLGCAKRHVLTTRRDGSLQINVSHNGQFLVTPEREILKTPLTGLLAAS